MKAKLRKLLDQIDTYLLIQLRVTILCVMFKTLSFR